MGFYEEISALRRTEKRTIGGVPWEPWLNPMMRFDIGGPVHPSRAVYGQDQALGLPALYAGSKILAEAAASLPIRVYNKSGGTTQLYTGPTLFDKPSVLGSTFDWMFCGMMSLILHGNAWGLITSKDAYGFPRGIEWLPPQEIIVEDDPEHGFNPLRARVYFRGRPMKWFGPDTELFHINSFPLPFRLEGLSLIRAFATTIQAGKSMENYGLAWFDNGGFPPGAFKNVELELDPDQTSKIKSMLTSAIRKHEPLVYGRDWEYTPITVPPSEAQFIDAMQLNATQIAAILNLPPDRVGGKRGDSLTYNTVEMSTLQIIDALRPWLVRFESAFSELLPGNRCVRFRDDALLKTDLQTRTLIHQQQRAMGLLTIDEIREKEDLPPLSGKMGQDVIPLDLMVALGTRAGAIPKSLVPEITFLMDHAADALEELQGKGLAAAQPVDPNTGQPQPAAESPQAMLASMVAGFSRKYPDYAYNDVVLFLRELSDRAVAARDPNRNGAWMPSVRDIADSL